MESYLPSSLGFSSNHLLAVCVFQCCGLDINVWEKKALLFIYLFIYLQSLFTKVWFQGSYICIADNISSHLDLMITPVFVIFGRADAHTE